MFTIFFTPFLIVGILAQRDFYDVEVKKIVLSHGIFEYREWEF